MASQKLANPNEELRGKIAIITGAGSGLGRQFSISLAQAGAHAVCLDVDALGLAETMSAIERAGGKGEAHECDVARSGAVEARFEHLLASDRAADILVNNAGIATPPARTHEVADKDWDRLLQINLNGVFYACRAALPGMLRKGRGSIINIASILGLRGYFPGVASTTVSYAASKGAVISMTRQIAAEYAREGIRVNAICPGWHYGTNLGRERKGNATPEEVARFEETIAQRTPLGRRGSPQELASLVLYLASDSSSFVTGQVFNHDGGWSAV